MRNYTDITFLLDRSGSMASVASDVVGAVNHFINSQKAAGDNASLTLIEFDGDRSKPSACIYQGGVTWFPNVRIITRHTAKPITEVPDFDKYTPTGSTPLLDALGRSITDTGYRLGAMPEAERPDKVLFVVYTDGLENASRAFTREQIKNMISHQREKYNWQFIFLGANQDAITEAASLGISPETALNFSASAGGINATAGYLSNNVAMYRSAGTADMLIASAEQRKEMEQK